MDLAAYSINCSDDLGDRLGYIVTLVLSFVAFSDTLFQQIPNVPYLTFLEEYVLLSYLFTTVTLIQTAFASWMGSCEDQENNQWWFAIFSGLFIIEHILFIVAAFYKRSYELSKLVMTREEVESLIESKTESLYLQYTYDSLRSQLNVARNNPKRTKLLSFGAMMDTTNLVQITFCFGIVQKALKNILNCFSCNCINKRRTTTSSVADNDNQDYPSTEQQRMRATSESIELNTATNHRP